MKPSRRLRACKYKIGKIPLYLLKDDKIKKYTLSFSPVILITSFLRMTVFCFTVPLAKKQNTDIFGDVCGEFQEKCE